MEQGSTIDFHNSLPEGCISHILSLTSPREACRSALVSSIFRSAADSDSVWERFLPADYKQILSKVVSPSPSVDFSSKKELYFRLCDEPILIDEGTKSFALEKWSGKKCYMIGAKELSIVWGDTPKHWRWRLLSDSRFSEVAELLNVCWLEIHGKMETRMMSPHTTYVAYLVLKFTEGAYGFDFPPAEVSVKLTGDEARDGDGSEEVQTVYLDPSIAGMRRWQLGPHRRIGLFRRSFRFSHALPVPESVPQMEGNVPKERGDGWMEIKMGEFFNDLGDDGEVEMSLLEVKGGNWKAGLIIQGIELRPKESK